MRLFRFAIIGLHGLLGKADEWRTFSLTRDGAVVRVMQSVDERTGLALFVCADVGLSEVPSVDDQGMIEVPDDPRRLAEKAIDAAANLVSVATGHGRSTTSRNLPVAFYADSDDEWAFLRSLAGIKGVDRGVGVGRMSVFTTKDELARLNDREDGMSLLAEAMSQDHMGGRYRDLLRVFERAFAESADRLVPMLADFLALRPRLGYSKTEVKYWVVRLRGRAIHADRHSPLVGADLENYVDRILLAAYEVLFNKENWHSYDSSRRDVWTPLTGPLDADGNWFYLQHRTEAPHLGQLYDTYGVYPLNLAASGVQLSDEYWPNHGPEKTTAGGYQISIIPANELAVVPGLAPSSTPGRP